MNNKIMTNIQLVINARRPSRTSPPSRDQKLAVDSAFGNPSHIECIIVTVMIIAVIVTVSYC